MSTDFAKSFQGSPKNPGNDSASREVQRLLRLDVVDREPALAFAINMALGHLNHSRLAAAADYLRYAHRLDLTDMGIAFVLGHFELALGNARAVELFSEIAVRTGFREQQRSLILAYQNFGFHSAAADTLHVLLSGNAFFADLAFTELANKICSPSRCGWCGLSNSGLLKIGRIPAAFGVDGLKIFLDGIPLSQRYPTQIQSDGTVLVRLPKAFRKTKKIRVLIDQVDLIGSPIDVGGVTRFEGVIACWRGGISGWCWFPGEPDFIPIIKLTSQVEPKCNLRIKARREVSFTSKEFQFHLPRQIDIDAAKLANLTGAIDVFDPNLRHLLGSPLNPSAEIDYAISAVSAVRASFPLSEQVLNADAETHWKFAPQPSIPIGINRQLHSLRPARRPRVVDIIIPVYSDLPMTRSCLESVFAGRSLEGRIIVIVDGSSDQNLVSWLRQVELSDAITLRINESNRGFPATVNIGLRMSQEADVILLNNDTIVPSGWDKDLQDVVYSGVDIGTATPLSNNATIFSYPNVEVSGPMPTLMETNERHAAARLVNEGITVQVPTAHGFCMYIRRECLEETGVLRDDLFAQGYGEENEFCRRSSIFGWRHVAAPGVYVAHRGGQSFRGAAAHLSGRNIAIVNRLFPGYDAMVEEWIKSDPLRVCRRRLDVELLKTVILGSKVALLVSHAGSGGVARHVSEREELYQRDGYIVLTLNPDTGAAEGRICTVRVGNAKFFQNLKFHLPSESSLLLAFFETYNIQKIEFHHFIRHHPDIFRIIRRLEIDYDVMIHDYSWFCPRIRLVNHSNGYCGEPSQQECSFCVADNGSEIEEDISPTELWYRSDEFLKGARRIIAPSNDTARRMMSHFPIKVEVMPWETNVQMKLNTRKVAKTAMRRICIVGAIGVDKGYKLLLDCARLVAAERAPVRFLLVGHTIDDRRLLKTGCVHITGPYAEAETIDLIKEQDADFGFLPSLWPETWSYTLSQMWRAGLKVVALDIGAQAERIKKENGGHVLPLHTRPKQLVDFFLSSALLR